MFNTIEQAISDIRAGRIIIVLDDEDRENEGDFVMAADQVTPEAINFMCKFGRGLICTPITRERAKALNLAPMVAYNQSSHETAFTVSVDSLYCGTGISAFDRSETIKVLSSDMSRASDLVRPGHIFPLIAKEGGVLSRPGHTEAAIDLARLAGRDESGIICEIMDEDGSMATRDKLFEISKQFDLKIITIKDLINYRLKSTFANEEEVSYV